MEENLFKVGDVVISQDSIGGMHKQVVERITKTQAVLASGTKLKIDGAKGCRSIGASVWGSTYYYKSTPELEEKYLTYKLQCKLNNALLNLKVKSLTNDELLDLIVVVERSIKK